MSSSVFFQKTLGPTPKGYHRHHACLNSRCLDLAHIVLVRAPLHRRIHAPNNGAATRRKRALGPSQGLGLRQIEVLKVLRHHGPLTFADLAELAYGSRYRTTDVRRLVEALEARRLVVIDRTDRPLVDLWTPSDARTTVLVENEQPYERSTMQLQIAGVVFPVEQRNGGWFAVPIVEPGSNYPKKLSTKNQQLVSQAQQLVGQFVTAFYNESESTNINPNSGTPYMNRYLEQLVVGQAPYPAQQPQQPQQPQPQYAQPPQPQQFQPPPPQLVQPQPQQPTPQPVLHTRVPDDLREDRIMRQSAAKVAVGLLPMLTPEDQNLASLVRISEQLVQYFRNGVRWEVPAAPPLAQQVAQNPNHPAQDLQQNPGFAQQVQQYQGDPGPQGIPVDPSYGAAPQYADDDIPFGPAIW